MGGITGHQFSEGLYDRAYTYLLLNFRFFEHHKEYRQKGRMRIIRPGDAGPVILLGYNSCNVVIRSEILTCGGFDNHR